MYIPLTPFFMILGDRLILVLWDWFWCFFLYVLLLSWYDKYLLLPEFPLIYVTFYEYQLSCYSAITLGLFYTSPRFLLEWFVASLTFVFLTGLRCTLFWCCCLSFYSLTVAFIETALISCDREWKLWHAPQQFEGLEGAYTMPTVLNTVSNISVGSWVETFLVEMEWMFFFTTRHSHFIIFWLLVIYPNNQFHLFLFWFLLHFVFPHDLWRLFKVMTGEMMAWIFIFLWLFSLSLLVPP